MTDANRAARRPAAPRPARLPRILVAGEFSSGKTQLISGLLGEAVLPSNVISTALPPIWLVAGSALRVAIAHDGTEREVDGIEAFDLATTAFGVVAHGAPILNSFEIIDTPGNSDPNIPPETWQRMVDYADAVVWCTNATQAWRQSEKAVWQDMPQVLGDINASGYGLTLGVHSRIDGFAREVFRATRVGNTYINRNMVGAVVGVNPFGGQGLSGTGPKAGGPHYLQRFATEKTRTDNVVARGGNTQLFNLQESTGD